MTFFEEPKQKSAKKKRRRNLTYTKQIRRELYELGLVPTPHAAEPDLGNWSGDCGQDDYSENGFPD